FYCQSSGAADLVYIVISINNETILQICHCMLYACNPDRLWITRTSRVMTEYKECIFQITIIHLVITRLRACDPSAFALLQREGSGIRGWLAFIISVLLCSLKKTAPVWRGGFCMRYFICSY